MTWKKEHWEAKTIHAWTYTHTHATHSKNIHPGRQYIQQDEKKKERHQTKVKRQI